MRWVRITDYSEAAATIMVAALGWVVALVGWLGTRRRARVDERARRVALADQLLVAVVAYQGLLEAHRVQWASLESRWKIALLAAAHVVEGKARHGAPFAGLGGAARAVLEWDAGGVAAAQSLIVHLERIAAAALALDGCGDEAMAVASRRVIEALPRTASGARQAWVTLEAAVQGVAEERRRLASA